MRSLFRVLTSSVMLLTFATAQTLTWIRPEEATAMGVDEAKAQCDQYMNDTAAGSGTGDLQSSFLAADSSDVTKIPELSAKGVFSRCTPPEDVKNAVKLLSSPASQIPLSNPENAEFESCKAKTLAAWRTLAPHCVVLQKSDTAITEQYISMIAYLAAGAACLVSLIIAAANEWNFSGQWAKGLFIACMALGAVGLLADVAGVIHVATSDGGGSGGGQMGLSLVGGAAGLIGTVVPAVTSTMLSANTAAAGDAVAGLVVATVLFFAIGFIKLASIDQIKSTKEKSAHEVGVLASDFPLVGTGGLPQVQLPPSNPQLSARGGAGGSGAGGASSGGANSDSKPGGALDRVNDDLNTASGFESSFSANSSFSTKDPLTQRLNKDGKFTDALKQVKMSGGDLPKAGSAALSGGGIKGFLQGMGGKFAEAADKAPGLIADVEKLAREDFEKTALARQLAQSGLVAQVGGGAKSVSAAGASSASFASFFGGAKSPSGAGAAVSKFDPKAPKKPDFSDLPESTDIWHGTDPRTIFQILSRRVDRVRDRVSPLDWHSKYNRLQAASVTAGASAPASGASPTPANARPSRSQR